MSHGNAVDIGQLLPYMLDLSERVGCSIFTYDYSGSVEPSFRLLLFHLSRVWFRPFASLPVVWRGPTENNAPKKIDNAPRLRMSGGGGGGVGRMPSTAMTLPASQSVFVRAGCSRPPSAISRSGCLTMLMLTQVRVVFRCCTRGEPVPGCGSGVSIPHWSAQRATDPGGLLRHVDWVITQRPPRRQAV